MTRIPERTGLLGLGIVLAIVAVMLVWDSLLAGMW